MTGFFLTGRKDAKKKEESVKARDMDEYS